MKKAINWKWDVTDRSNRLDTCPTSSALRASSASRRAIAWACASASEPELSMSSGKKRVTMCERERERESHSAAGESPPNETIHNQLLFIPPFPPFSTQIHSVSKYWMPSVLEGKPQRGFVRDAPPRPGTAPVPCPVHWDPPTNRKIVWVFKMCRCWGHGRNVGVKNWGKQFESWQTHNRWHTRRNWNVSSASKKRLEGLLSTYTFD